MMTIDPSQHQTVPQFTSIYFEVVIFELTAHYGNGVHITFERIADTFNIAARISEKFPDLLYPCADVIRTNGLNDDLRVHMFIQTHKPIVLCLPIPTAIDTPVTLSLTATVADPKGKTDCRGYRITETGVCLPTWTVADEKMFLIQYAKVVPHHFKDDLAVFIHQLLNSWNISGCRGDVKMIHDGLEGLVKFTDMNATKRAVFDQHDKERCQRVERQKKEGQEKKYLEQEGRRLETEQENLREAERVRRAEEEEADRARKKQEELDRLREEEEERVEQARKEQQELDRAREEKEKLERAKEAELERFRKEKELSAPEEQPTLRTRDEMIEGRMQELLTRTRATDARKQQVLELMERLTSGLRSHFQNTGIEVLLFGSFATGLCDQNSDADFSVIDQSSSIDTITTVAEALKKLGYTHVESISNARVPIATFEDPVNRIQCDISLNQRHGVYNSMLIDVYRRIDGRFLSLWFAIKKLAKDNSILSGRDRYLTSYALVMMLITFLQAQRKPVLPRLQQPGTTTPGPNIEGSDYSFDEDWNKHTNAGSINDSTGAMLLIEFCRFYGAQVDFKTFEINARLGTIQKTRKMMHVKDKTDRNRLMDAQICVMDPFIVDCNLARNVPILHVKRIKKVFADARATLVNGDVDKFFS